MTINFVTDRNPAMKPGNSALLPATPVRTTACIAMERNPAMKAATNVLMTEILVLPVNFVMKGRINAKCRPFARQMPIARTIFFAAGLKFVKTAFVKMEWLRA